MVKFIIVAPPQDLLKRYGSLKEQHTYINSIAARTPNSWHTAGGHGFRNKKKIYVIIKNI